MKKVILTDLDIQRTLKRISFEIVERLKTNKDIVLVGIKTRGIFIAQQIHNNLKNNNFKVDLKELDITNFRDDIKKKQKIKTKQFNVDNKVIILVDDVLQTGRTVRAAISAIFEMGRAKEIKLITLIDRGHRELPFKPDFIGKNIPTSKTEKVKYNNKQIDGVENIILIKTQLDNNK